MTVLEYTLMASMLAIYITLLFTVAVLTWRKGHKGLFIFGIFFPILWLIGAILPPKPGYSTNYRG